MANSNCMIGFPNLIDAAALSGGSWLAARPLAKIQNRQFGDVARSTDLAATSTYIKVDLDKSRKARAVDLVNHNLSLSAKVRIRASDEAAATNLIRSSENFAASTVWSNTDGVVMSYLGSRVWTLNKVNAGTYSQVSQKITIPNDATQYAFRIEVAKDSIETRFPEFYVRLDGGPGADEIYVDLNTKTGAAAKRTSSGTVSFSVTSSGDYWLVVLTVKNSASGNVNANVGVRPAVGDVLGAWNASAVGAVTLRDPQFETGSAPSSVWSTPATFGSRASAATYFDATGTMQTAAANVARMTYDPSNLARPPYLLAEYAATNIGWPSNDVSHNNWTKETAGTGSLPAITPNFAAAPDGTATASRVVCSRGSGVDSSSYSLAYLTPSFAGTHCSSVWLKSNTGANQQVLIYAGGAGQTVTVTPTWTRFYVTSQTSSIAYLIIGTRGGSGAYYSGGDQMVDFLLWGAQIEAGSVPTSTITTTTGPVARAADVVTYSQTRPAGYMDDTQSYEYDSGWLPAWPTVYAPTELEWEDDNWWSRQYTDEERAGYTPGLVHIMPRDVLARYWRIDIQDSLNPAGYVDVGRLFIGPVFQPAANMSRGASLALETGTTVQEAESGSEYFDVKKPFRVARLALEWLTEAEGMSKAFELLRRAGIDKEVLWIHDPTDTVHAIRRQFIGRFRELSPIEFPYANVNKAAFEIKELL